MKVCIIGENLIGMTLAKALVNKDIFVDMLYDVKFKNYNQIRTVGISKSNIDYFNKNISDIKKKIWEIKNIKIFTENSIKNEIINFSDSNKQLFSIIKNHELYDQLKNELKISKFFKKKKNMNYRKLFKKKDYKLIINCNPNHEITKKYFTNKLEKKYNSFAYVTIIDHKKLSFNSTATQIFTDNGPIAFLPFSDTKTSIVYSLKIHNDFKNHNVINLIKKFNPKYNIKKIYNISKFELSSSNLRKYYFQNILAFGDLLHRVHPLAGQGYNMSIRDIKKLLYLIDKRLDLGLEIDNSICAEFQSLTKDKNYIFSKGIDLVYEFFNIESKMNSQILRSSIEFIGKNKLINQYLKKFADTGM